MLGQAGPGHWRQANDAASKWAKQLAQGKSDPVSGKKAGRGRSHGLVGKEEGDLIRNLAI